MRPAGVFRRCGFYLALVLFCVFAIFPAVWMAITAFKRNADLYNPANNPFLFNLPPALSHIEFLCWQTNYPIFLWNSFFIGIIVVAITLVLAVPAAYSLARLTGHWGEHSSIAIFLVYLIPPTLLFIPLYEIVTLLGLANSVWSLILVYPTITIPFLYLASAKLFSFDSARCRGGRPDRRLEPRRRLPPRGTTAGGPGYHNLRRIRLCTVAKRLHLCGGIRELYCEPHRERWSAHGIDPWRHIYYWQALMATTGIVGIPLAVIYGLLFDWLVKGFQVELPRSPRA